MELKMAGVTVGILNDMADPAPGPGDIGEWLEREVHVLQNAGRIDFPVNFAFAYGLGLPSGTSEAVETAYRQLVDAGAGMIVGPAIGDNALVITPLAEQLRVPTINWAGAERARGRWMFQLQVGSHEDESLLIARHLAAIGATGIGVIHDRSAIGTRHFKCLQDEARVLGLEIVAAEGISPLGEDAGVLTRTVLKSRPEAFVYLGLGLSAPAAAAVLTEAGWTGPKIMNTAGLRGYHGDFAQALDGWLYLDLVSDDNRTLHRLLAETAMDRTQAPAVARGHDLGRVIAEALARAPDRSRDGLRLGLERVKWLPAAQGREGTLLGFGVCDRGALHGRYLVMRQWQDGVSREIAGNLHMDGA
ncbi:ABC transporter substrate-binding protein [Novosphingobium sp. PhB55]|uniref:ABC transporter substrate-binding protein n=1 Tax=Novosphingobium sp. PhB55 TaxID=2485106 RepID=UPI001FBA3077|nr:ABC transporter substrate-binding protein [Novosphingobium sp. PhB55]